MLVRYPPPKTSEPVDELPNPDLNPLLNPTLGRNLGRWAEVYFTSPPEKREEAVGELLRELKENPAAAATEAEFAHDDLSLKEAVAALEARAFNKSSEVLTTTTSGVQCAECGHRHPAAQRFCGMCGAPLATDELDPQDYGHQQAVSVARREPDPAYHTSIFGLDTSAPVTQPSLSNGADINWLREKHLAGGSEGSSGFRKLIPPLLAMAAIGILIYAQSATKHAAPPHGRNHRYTQGRERSAIPSFAGGTARRSCFTGSFLCARSGACKPRPERHQCGWESNAGCTRAEANDGARETDCARSCSASWAQGCAQGCSKERA